MSTHKMAKSGKTDGRRLKRQPVMVQAACQTFILCQDVDRIRPAKRDWIANALSRNGFRRDRGAQEPGDHPDIIRQDQ